jgi:hypothetical protein
VFGAIADRTSVTTVLIVGAVVALILDAVIRIKEPASERQLAP